jgi:hypothetical protein
MLSIDSDPYSNNDYSHTDAQLHMIMSKEAISSGTSPKTLKFMGEIEDNSMAILVFFLRRMAILVDSGNSHSFIYINLASLLYSMSTTPRPVKVQDTNG